MSLKEAVLLAGFEKVTMNDLTPGELIYVPYIDTLAVASGVGTSVVKAGSFVLDESDEIYVDPTTLMTTEQYESWLAARELENNIMNRSIERIGELLS